MKRIGTVIAVAALATAGTTAFAGQDVQQAKPQAVKMSDAQLDNVAAGQLINVQIVDLLNNNNVEVAIPVHAAVNVAAAVGVLSSGILARADQPLGNVNQRVRQ